jgi:hypothetical protein
MFGCVIRCRADERLVFMNAGDGDDAPSGAGRNHPPGAPLDTGECAVEACGVQVRDVCRAARRATPSSHGPTRGTTRVSATNAEVQPAG